MRQHLVNGEMIDMTPDEEAEFLAFQQSMGAPTIDKVVDERNRRLSLGFDHDFGGARGVHHIGTTAQDQVGWQEVTTIALARKASGSTSSIAILTNTGPTEVTPDEWLAVIEAAAAFRQPIWAASFALQAMNPIPANYKDDSYWP